MRSAAAEGWYLSPSLFIPVIRRAQALQLPTSQSADISSSHYGATAPFIEAEMSWLCKDMKMGNMASNVEAFWDQLWELAPAKRVEYILMSLKSILSFSHHFSKLQIHVLPVASDAIVPLVGLHLTFTEQW